MWFICGCVFSTQLQINTHTQEQKKEKNTQKAKDLIPSSRIAESHTRRHTEKEREERKARRARRKNKK